MYSYFEKSQHFLKNKGRRETSAQLFLHMDITQFKHKSDTNLEGILLNII